jgi:hypothetical protein
VKVAWAIAAGLALGIGAAWWFSRSPPDGDRASPQRGEGATAASAHASAPGLYRWRDSAGVLHVTQAPPKDRRYERIDSQPRDGIEVHGDRR